MGYTAVKNELGVADRWRWWRWRRETGWREVDMVAEGLVREVTEADGQKVLVLSENWRPAAGRWFVSGAMVNENWSVEVVNASGKGGSGNNVAKMIEAAGIKVIKVESGEAILGKCVVETPEAERNKLGVRWLMAQLGCKWMRGEGGKVVVGKEYGEWWKGD
ncbi:hypothetical protein HYS82_00800 [Candidatus Amesbacteria bacterium]|nr:hypothetical protein [Candidatus Amesbacteria bacterium]